MNKGFTLVELIAVVTILAILAVITMPAYQTISTNIKTRNYESKKSTISSETLAYVEKYMKDKIYDGTGPSNYCFTVNFLIQNGIVISDDEEKEYIKNEITDETYSGSQVYIMVYYDLGSLKLKSEIINNSNSFSSGSIEEKCRITLN